jgi:hypothetical protein
VAKTNKLVRRLKRELTANPKKGAALAVLLAVAIWFWLPLVEKFWGQKPEENVANKTKPVAASAVADTANAAEAGDANKLTNDHWKQVVDWIHNDPMMKPQFPTSGARNPFGPSEARRLAREEANRTAAPPPPPDATPQESGLVLSSTVIGARMRTAMINQRAYHEGQIVKAPKDEDRFKLVRIETNYVVLENNGKQYQLKLPTVEMAGVDE